MSSMETIGLFYGIVQVVVVKLLDYMATFVYLVCFLACTFVCFEYLSALQKRFEENQSCSQGIRHSRSVESLQQELVDVIKQEQDPLPNTLQENVTLPINVMLEELFGLPKPICEEILLWIHDIDANFINIWLQYLTPDDELKNLLDHTIAYAIGILARKLSKVNVVDFSTRNLCNVVLCHLKLYSKIHSIRPNQFHEYLHPACQINHHKENEDIKHLRKIVTHILPEIMSKTDTSCQFVHKLVRDILANCILKPIVQSINPTNIQQWIVMIIQNQNEHENTEYIRGRVPVGHTASDLAWISFAGQINRLESEAILQKHSVGTYLIRKRLESRAEKFDIVWISKLMLATTSSNTDHNTANSMDDTVQAIFAHCNVLLYTGSEQLCCIDPTPCIKHLHNPSDTKHETLRGMKYKSVTDLVRAIFTCHDLKQHQGVQFSTAGAMFQSASQQLAQFKAASQGVAKSSSVNSPASSTSSSYCYIPSYKGDHNHHQPASFFVPAPRSRNVSNSDDTLLQSDDNEVHDGYYSDPEGSESQANQHVQNACIIQHSLEHRVQLVLKLESIVQEIVRTHDANSNSSNALAASTAFVSSWLSTTSVPTFETIELLNTLSDLLTFGLKSTHSVFQFLKQVETMNSSTAQEIAHIATLKDCVQVWISSALNTKTMVEKLIYLVEKDHCEIYKYYHTCSVLLHKKLFSRILDAVRSIEQLAETMNLSFTIPSSILKLDTHDRYHNHDIQFLYRRIDKIIQPRIKDKAFQRNKESQHLTYFHQRTTLRAELIEYKVVFGNGSYYLALESQHIEYVIQVTVNYITFHISKRYTDFLHLHTNLKLQYQPMGLMIHLPPKRPFEFQDRNFVLKRQKELNRYLQYILSDVRIQYSFEVLLFLQVDTIRDEILKQLPCREGHLQASTTPIVPDLSMEIPHPHSYTLKPVTINHIENAEKGLFRLLSELFEIKEMNMLRRQLIIFTKRVVSLSAQNTFLDRLNEMYQDTLNVSTILQVSCSIRSNLWAKDTAPLSSSSSFLSNTKAADLENEEIEEVVLDYLSSILPSGFSSLLGEDVTLQGTRKLYHFTQNAMILESLTYSILDVIMVQLFPELYPHVLSFEHLHDMNFTYQP